MNPKALNILKKDKFELVGSWGNREEWLVGSGNNRVLVILEEGVIKKCFCKDCSLNSIWDRKRCIFIKSLIKKLNLKGEKK